MARVRYADPDAVSADHPKVAEALRRLPPLNVFRLMARAESAFVPWLRFGGVILGDLVLDPLLRELVILQVGKLAARYEWDQHVPIATDVGASPEQLAALDRGEVDAACFTPVQRAALRFTSELVAGDVSDGAYAALAEHLTEREIVELTLTAAHYLMLARIMTTLQIDPDPPAGSAALLGRKAPGGNQ